MLIYSCDTWIFGPFILPFVREKIAKQHSWSPFFYREMTPHLQVIVTLRRSVWNFISGRIWLESRDILRCCCARSCETIGSIDGKANIFGYKGRIISGYWHECQDFCCLRFHLPDLLLPSFRCPEWMQFANVLSNLPESKMLFCSVGFMISL